MGRSILFVFLIFILIGCSQNENQNKTSTDPLMDNSKIEFDTTFFYFRAKNSLSTTPISKLSVKLESLNKLKQKYIPVKQGKIKTSDSIVFKAIRNKPELCFSSKNCYKIPNLKLFEQSIHSINYALIQGDKQIGKGVSKAEIEELIFYDTIAAKTLFDYINSVRIVEYFWDTIDRTPSDMFIEENKLYFVRMKNNAEKTQPKIIAERMR